MGDLWLTILELGWCTWWTSGTNAGWLTRSWRWKGGELSEGQREARDRDSPSIWRDEEGVGAAGCGGRADLHRGAWGCAHADVVQQP